MMMTMKLPQLLLLNHWIATTVMLGMIGWIGITPAYSDYPAGPSPKIIMMPQPARPTWKLGSMAPSLHIMELSGQKISLSQFLGKPLVLEFGSLTEPAFRLSAPSMNWLARKWKNKVQFLVVYQSESHPDGTSRELQVNQKAGLSIPQARTQPQRAADARLAQRKLHLQIPLIAIDNADNQTAKAYGSLPNMTFLINAHGQLLAAWPWMTPWQLNGAIQALLAGKAIPYGDMSAGFTPNTMPPMEFDYRALPPASPQILAAAIDRAGVTRHQLANIIPAVTAFSSALLKTREHIAQLRSAKGQFNGAFRRSVRKAFDSLGKSAAELKRSLRQFLNNQQYQEILSAIDRGRMRRIFDQPRP
jgi:hypothetical protein